MVNIVKGLFNFVLTVQIVLLFLFVGINYDHLDSVPFELNINGTIYSLTLNMYVVAGIISLILLLVVVSSLSVFGVGINDAGSTNIAKYIALSMFMSLFLITSSYFILPFGYFGLMAQIVSVLIYVIYAIGSLNESSLE